MAILTVLAGLLLCPAAQDRVDPVIKAWIRKLGSGSIEEHERASKALLDIGEPALPALRTALASDDLELRSRARHLVEHVERAAREELHDREERARVFKGDAELDIHAVPGSSARTKGAVFAFKLRKREGGTVLTTFLHPNPLVRIDYRIPKVVDKVGKELPIERCSRCSPGIIFVRHPGPIRPQVKGKLCWWSGYPLVFENPKNGDLKRVGQFEVEVKWPRLEIRSAAALPATVFPGKRTSFEFDVKQPLRAGDLLYFVSGKTSFKGKGTRDRTGKGGCWCREGPVQGEKPAEPMIDRRVVGSENAHLHSLQNVIRIRYQFPKLIEEPFEAAPEGLLKKP